MNYPASILILVFLAVTFITSAHDKLFHWNDNVSWLKGHFAKTIIKDFVPASLGLILLLELIAGVLSVLGVFQILFLANVLLVFMAQFFRLLPCCFYCLGSDWRKNMMGLARLLFILFRQFWRCIGWVRY